MSIKEFIQDRNQGGGWQATIYGVPIVLLRQVEFNLPSSVKQIETRLPEKFFTGLEMIHVGQYPDLINSDRDSSYIDNQIFILSSLGEDEFQSALIHELAHHVEGLFGNEIYGDESVLKEFIRKRLALFGKMSERVSGLQRELFANVNYSEQIEKMFFVDVGEEIMQNYVIGLFPNVYSAVSVREYFANGIENTTANQKSSNYIKVISPALYAAIERLFTEN